MPGQGLTLSLHGIAAMLPTLRGHMVAVASGGFCDGNGVSAPAHDVAVEGRDTQFKLNLNIYFLIR